MNDDAEGQAIQAVAMRKDISAEIQFLRVNSNQRAASEIVDGSDADGGYASMNGGKGILQLRNHAANDDAIGDQCWELLLRNMRDEGRGV